jgi:hypothetical protein
MLIVLGVFRCSGNDVQSMLRKLSHRVRCEGAEPREPDKKKLKKRHVEVVTRLPTKRMATACWAFIVAKSTPLETAPMLDFSSLRATNIKIHPQDIHKVVWTAWG